MNPVFWYLDAQRERQGPFEREDIVGFIREGTIARDTLVWDSSLNEWRAAAALPEFSALFGGTVPPSGAPTPPRMPPLPLEGGPLAFARPGALKADIPVWGLFWRGLVRSIGFLLVIPAPWAAAFFFRFLCSRITLPNGARLSFAGKAGDIWYIHVAIAVLALAGRYEKLAVVCLLLSLGLQLYVIRWVCDKLRASDGSLHVSFKGHLFNLLSWYLFLCLSILTIIGWAWVLKGMYRWICRSVEGTHRFEFTATGLEILWRVATLFVQFLLIIGISLVTYYFIKTGKNIVWCYPMFFLLGLLVILIPWTVRWLTSWWISKIAVAA
jgi:hypothetical protein